MILRTAAGPRPQRPCLTGAIGTAQRPGCSIVLRPGTGRGPFRCGPAALARLRTQADRVLIDEKRGRAVALREGVAIIGLVGVLVAAKRRGFLASVGGLLNLLEMEAGFRLSQSVKAAALQAVGE